MATDNAGNNNTAATQLSLVSDRTAPVGYSVSIDLLGETQINVLNETIIEFSGSGLEVGATLNYSFTSNNGGTPVTGTEKVTSTSQTFNNGGAGYDLSGLADGMINLTVTLTDAAGNTGANATSTAAKDAAPPSGYTVAWNDVLISAAEARNTSFTVSNTEVGARLNYTVSSSGDGNTATVTGNITVSSSSEVITLDVSSLTDGNLIVQVSLTDGGGNKGATVTDNSAVLDQSAPSGYGVNIDQVLIDNTNASSVSFTFSGAEPGAAYSYTFISSGGAGAVSGSGNIATTTDQITAIDLSSLRDGLITLSVLLTDPAGNTGSLAADNVTKLTTILQFASVSASGNESNAGTNANVELSAASTQNVSVDYTITGTATGGGTDYTLANGTLTINAGNSSGSISIANIVDDNILEPNETVIITLSNPVNASLGTNTQFTYTIIDNDNAAVTIADVSGNEDDGAITITATLDNAVQGGFTVDVSTADGTATTSDSDYTAVTSQTLVFSGIAGETQTFTITLTADDRVEGNETITVSQANLSVTTLFIDISDQATVTITNDDSAPVVTANQVFTVSEKDPNGTVVGSVSATDADAGTTLQAWRIVSGNIGTDGDTNAPFTIDANGQLIINDSDDLNAAMASFSLEIEVSDGANVGSAVVTVNVNIVNDPPSFAAGSDISVPEDSPAQTFNGWATAISPGPADESSQTVTFSVTNDNTSLFSQQPSVSQNGTLTFTPAPDQFGTATVTVSLSDDGGTANGGDDTSDNQNFVITIESVNDAPSSISLSNNTIAENEPANTAVGDFSSEDVDRALDANETATYTLVSGAGDFDNNLFNIQGNTLYTNQPLDFDAQPSYSIRVAVTDAAGASFEQTFTIEITDEADARAYLPNLFSPNGDMTNDLFILRANNLSSVRWRIFNKQGVLVYETDNVQEATTTGWDGTSNGEPQPSGTYVWQLDGAFTDGAKLSIEGKQLGNITLIR